MDRTIKKEPAYCLLVFGPEAKPRVSLVLDDDTLYVDRNGVAPATFEVPVVDPEKAPQ